MTYPGWAYTAHPDAPTAIERGLEQHPDDPVHSEEAWDNLADAIRQDGPGACPCMTAATCPLHWCPCMQYRNPWDCDC